MNDGAMGVNVGIGYMMAKVIATGSRSGWPGAGSGMKRGHLTRERMRGTGVWSTGPHWLR